MSKAEGVIRDAWQDTRQGRRTRLIVAESSGQLGNQIILFAHLIALAEEFGFSVTNPAFHAYRAHFSGARLGLIASYPNTSGGSVEKYLTALVRPDQIHRTSNLTCRSLRRLLPASNLVVSHLSCQGHSPEFDIDLSSAENMAILRRSALTLLFGWRYRNYDLFLKHEDRIRDYFSFYDQSAAQSLVCQFRQRVDNVIGIHVRRGDYAQFEGGKYYMDLVDYVAAARHLAGQLQGRTGIVICSNEVQDLGAFDGLEAVRGPGSAIGDMQALSMCDYIIGVPSTFSRWASFIGRVPLAVIQQGELQPAISSMKAARW